MFEYIKKMKLEEGAHKMVAESEELSQPRPRSKLYEWK